MSSLPQADAACQISRQLLSTSITNWQFGILLDGAGCGAAIPIAVS